MQSRPTQVHGIDIVTDKPHVFSERTEADEADKVLRPGMIIMAEPNPITADGMFGIFLGHTFIVTADGMRRRLSVGNRGRRRLIQGMDTRWIEGRLNSPCSVAASTEKNV